MMDKQLKINRVKFGIADTCTLHFRKLLEIQVLLNKIDAAVNQVKRIRS